MENNNRIIKEELYVTEHFKYAHWLLTITSQFIANIMENHTLAIFQSGFGFMNNDIPFTMLIYRAKKFSTINIIPEDAYEILFLVNDWGHFRIQNDDFLPTHEWELNLESDKKGIPDWEELTPLQIIAKHPIIGLTASEGCIGKAPLFDKIYQLLCYQYINDDENYASDYLECHVACIYTED